MGKTFGAVRKKTFSIRFLVGYNGHLPPNFDNGTWPLPEANSGHVSGRDAYMHALSRVNRPKKGKLTGDTYPVSSLAGDQEVFRSYLNKWFLGRARLQPCRKAQ